MSNLKKQVTRWVDVLREGTEDQEEMLSIIADAAILYLAKDKVFNKADMGKSINDQELADLLEVKYLL